METITVNIQSKSAKEKIVDFLQQFNKEDVEFTSIDDIKDLRLLQNTRGEDSIPFDEYLKNEN